MLAKQRALRLELGRVQVCLELVRAYCLVFRWSQLKVLELVDGDSIARAGRGSVGSTYLPAIAESMSCIRYARDGQRELMRAHEPSLILEE